MGYEPKMYDVLTQVHPTLRAGAEQILHAMLCGTDLMDWDRKQRLVIQNVLVPGTDIVELLEFILSPLDSSLEPPNGYKLFLESLGDIGLESEWVRNVKAAWYLKQREDDDTDTESEYDEDSEMEEGECDDEETDDNEEDDGDEEETDDEEEDGDKESDDSKEDDSDEKESDSNDEGSYTNGNKLQYNTQSYYKI